MERPTPSDAMPKRYVERNVDLDKKIEDLRRKNAVLMRRYQEVEEDKKMAEEDVPAPQGRKGKTGDLSITISHSTGSRVVVTKPYVGGGPAVKGQQGGGSGRAGEGSLPGTTAGKKGKRLLSERLEPGGDAARGPAEDRQGLGGEAASGGGKQTAHASARRDAGATQEFAAAVPPACSDPTAPTSPEGQEEYMCWKRERERIDRERVARHKNATGQWRRTWDVDKSESMFSDKCPPEKERGAASKSGRNARRAHPRSHPQDTQGPVGDKVKDKGSKAVPVVSSKAKGKDRLTGRARRPPQGTDAGVPSSRATEKRVRFSEELVEGAACAAAAAEGPAAATTPRPREAGEASSPGGGAQRGSDAPQEAAGGAPPPDAGDGPEHAVREQAATPVGPAEKDGDSPAAEQTGGSGQESSEPPTEHAKCNTSNRNTEELIDGLSLLSMESRDTCSTDATNTDKARENGKIV